MFPAVRCGSYATRPSYLGFADSAVASPAPALSCEACALCTPIGEECPWRIEMGGDGVAMVTGSARVNHALMIPHAELYMTALRFVVHLDILTLGFSPVRQRWSVVSSCAAVLEWQRQCAFTYVL